MKSFLQLMPVLLSFYFLSSSVSCALDANEYLKSDMFDFSFNRLNNVSEGTEYGLTLKNDFFTRDDCANAKIITNFPYGEIQGSDDYCLRKGRYSLSGSISKLNEIDSESENIPYYTNMNFGAGDTKKLEKCSDKAEDVGCYTLKGYSRAKDALEHVIELQNTDGQPIRDLELTGNNILKVEGYAVIHVKNLSMNAASRLISRNGSIIVIADEYAKFEGNSEKCFFSDSNSVSNLYEGCVFLSGAYVVAGKGIAAKDVIGNISEHCGNSSNWNFWDVFVSAIDNLFGIDCSFDISLYYFTDAYDSDSYELDHRHNIGIISSAVKFAAPNIDVRNSIIGNYNAGWNFSEVSTTTYIVRIPSKLVTCEQGEIEISSDNRELSSVEIKLNGVAHFASDGSQSATVSVSRNEPKTLIIASGRTGTTSVSLDGFTSCSSPNCQIEHVSSALRFYRDKNKSNVNTSFYAGQEQQLYLAAVQSIDSDGTCSYPEFIGNKVTLTSAKDSGDDIRLINYADAGSVVADKNGVTLTLEYSDGFYKLPGFTYNDADKFTLKADGRIKTGAADDDSSSDIVSGDVEFATSPYATYISVNAETCEHCHAELGEVYDSGKDITFSYIPKAWCKDLSEVTVNDEKIVVSNEALKKCPTAGSFSGTGDSNVAISAFSHGTSLENINENFLHTQELEWKTAGSRVLVNQIDNVGRFDFMINEFADPVSRLTVHKTVANDLSGYFAPWAFEVQYAGGNTYVTANACINNAANRHSFTYFGQPFPVKMQVIAKTANGLDATLFDETHYPQAVNYVPRFSAFSADDARLIDGNSNNRVIDCGVKCGSVTPSWEQGKLNYSDFYLRIMPLGTTIDDYGKNAGREYRAEIPSYNVSAADGMKHSANTANLGMQMWVEGANKTHYIDFEKSYKTPSVYSDMGREIISGTEKYIKLFGPLDLRMGRLVLDNVRANPKNIMYMPVKMQYFSKIKNGADILSEGEWIENTDDQCTRLGRQNFYVSSYLDNTVPDISLKSNKEINFGGHKSKVEMVSERNAAAEALEETLDGVTDQYAVAKNGKMYLRITPPEIPVMFMIHTATVTEHYEGGVSGMLTPLKSYDTKNPTTAFPSWFGISQESIEHAFGAFRAWPGNDRVIYRLDQN